MFKSTALKRVTPHALQQHSSPQLTADSRMPRRRRPLAHIALHILPDGSVSPTSEHGLHGRLLGGQSYAEIARAEKIPVETVKASIRDLYEQPTQTTSTHEGRLRKVSERDERRVLRYLKRNVEATFGDLKRDLGLDLDRDSVRTIKDRSRLESHRVLREKVNEARMLPRKADPASSKTPPAKIHPECAIHHPSTA